MKIQNQNIKSPKCTVFDDQNNNLDCLSLADKDWNKTTGYRLDGNS